MTRREGGVDFVLPTQMSLRVCEIDNSEDEDIPVNIDQYTMDHLQVSQGDPIMITSEDDHVTIAICYQLTPADEGRKMIRIGQGGRKQLHIKQCGEKDGDIVKVSKVKVIPYNQIYITSQGKGGDFCVRGGREKFHFKFVDFSVQFEEKIPFNKEDVFVGDDGGDYLVFRIEDVKPKLMRIFPIGYRLPYIARKEENNDDRIERGELSLKVHSFDILEDFEYKKACIDFHTMSTMKISQGDFIEVRYRDPRTILRCFSHLPADEGTGIIRIDRNMASSCQDVIREKRRLSR